MSLDAITASKISGMRRRYRANNQLDAEKGIMADENGAVSINGEDQYYNVRLANGHNADGSTQYGHAFPVLSGIYMGSEKVNTEVYIGMHWDGQMAVLGEDRVAIVEAGRNPRASNVNSPYRQFKYMKDSDLFLAIPLGTQQTQVMEVRVEPTSYIDDSGTKRFFPGGKIDLAGDVPAADGDGNAQHLISAVFANTSDVLESVTSTATLIDNVLTWDVDVAEAFANRSARAIPIRFYELFTGHVLLSKSDDFGDAREHITAPKRRNNFAATTAPTVNDDIDLRYEVGSKWYNITNDLMYTCIDSTADNAIWKRMITALAETTLIDDGDSPYTILPTDDVLFCNTSSGAITVNLPAGTGGQHFVIKNAGTSGNDVTVDPDGTEELYGAEAGIAHVMIDGENIDIHYSFGLGGWW